VFRQVSKEKTATRLWTKLESLYMTKSLVNYLNLKQALQLYKISSEKVISEQLNEFNKMILNMENIVLHFDYED